VCLSRARVSAQRACSERRCRSAASSGSPCGLEVLHMGNVVWTTAGALLGSINAGRYVGVDVVGMYIAEWGSYVSLLLCLVIQRLLVYTNPDISDRYTHTHSLFTNIQTRLSTWLSYAPSRLRSRQRCRPQQHPLRHQRRPRSRPLKESADTKTTACHVRRPKSAWIPSLTTTMSTRLPRRQRRRKRGSAASVRSSSSDS
jgi:hypothetical protein